PGRGAGAGRLHLGRPGAADPEAAAHCYEGRSGSGWRRAVAVLVIVRMMNFALFETAIGCCGIVWSERGITGVQLPERSEATTRNRLLRRFPAARDGAPPAEVRRAIDDIVALLGGEQRRDLNHVT